MSVFDDPATTEDFEATAADPALDPELDQDDVEGHGLREVAAGISAAAVLAGGGTAAFAQSAHHSPSLRSGPAAVTQVSAESESAPTPLTGVPWQVGAQDTPDAAAATDAADAPTDASVEDGAGDALSRAPQTSPSGWKLAYAEDFDKAAPTGTFPGANYARHWGVYNDGWKDTSKNGTYMPSKVLSVHDGTLDYYIHSENGNHLVAAPWLVDTKGHTYGRFSIRFRSDALPGYKTAWLLWPDSERWPADGEIDFPEGNLHKGGTISAFHHYARAAGGQQEFATKITYAAWHTVTVEWAPGRVTFFLDGTKIGSSATAVPRNPMHWVLQTETNLDGYAPSNAVRGHVQVDWVAYWTKA